LIEETDFATGCCMMIRQCPEKVRDLMRYFFYGEDVDLNRGKSAGIFDHVPQALCGIKAGSGGSGSKLQDYFTTRNRLLFAYYASIRTRFATREGVKILLHGRE
jgi:hypothetical protein